MCCYNEKVILTCMDNSDIYHEFEQSHIPRLFQPRGNEMEGFERRALVTMKCSTLVVTTQERYFEIVVDSSWFSRNQRQTER